MSVVSRIAGLQLILAMAALSVMGLVTVADVVLKYTLSRPITGAYDLVESLLPVVIFHGLPATLLRRQNIAIDLIDHLAGPQRTRFLLTAADGVMLVVLVLLTWAMVAPAMQALDYGDRKLELGLPIFVIWVAVGLGLLGAVLASVALLVQRRAPARP